MVFQQCNVVSKQKQKPKLSYGYILDTYISTKIGKWTGMHRSWKMHHTWIAANIATKIDGYFGWIYHDCGAVGKQ